VLHNLTTSFAINTWVLFCVSKFSTSPTRKRHNSQLKVSCGAAKVLVLTTETIVLAEENYETLELHYPRLRLEEAGYSVKTVGPKSGEIYKSKEGYWAKTNATFKDINYQEVKVLVVPGGFCTDRLRRYPECNTLVHDVFMHGGVVAFICHGGWVPVSAKILKGKKATCFFAIKDDLINAGALYSEDKVVVDGNLVSAQTPDDLPEFMKATLKAAESK